MFACLLFFCLIYCMNTWLGPWCLSWSLPTASAERCEVDKLFDPRIACFGLVSLVTSCVASSAVLEEPVDCWQLQELKVSLGHKQSYFWLTCVIRLTHRDLFGFMHWKWARKETLTMSSDCHGGESLYFTKLCGYCGFRFLFGRGCVVCFLLHVSIQAFCKWSSWHSEDSGPLLTISGKTVVFALTSHKKDNELRNLSFVLDIVSTACFSLGLLRCYLLGLLAMIKCSICSYQCDNWYVSNWRLACHNNFCFWLCGCCFCLGWFLKAVFTISSSWPTMSCTSPALQEKKNSLGLLLWGWQGGFSAPLPHSATLSWWLEDIHWSFAARGLHLSELWQDYSPVATYVWM